MSCNGNITNPGNPYEQIINFKCPGFVAYNITVIDKGYGDGTGDFELRINGNAALIGLNIVNQNIEYQYGVSNASLAQETYILKFTYSQLNYQIEFYPDGPVERATVSKGSGSAGTSLNNPNHPLNLNRHPNAPVESFKNMCRWDFWNWLWFLVIVLIIVYLIYYFAYKKKTINFDL